MGFSVSDVSSSVICKLYFKDTPKPYLVDSASVGQFVDYIPPVGKHSESVSCYNGKTNEYSGWRVLSINGIGLTGTVTLIHAGTSECCCVYEGQSSNGIAQLNNLCNAFINSRFASYGRSINCNDIKAYNGNACNSNIKPKPTIINNIIKTGSYYWLSSADGPDYLWAIDYSGYVTNGLRSKCLGVRPVIVLKSGIKNSGGQGTNESPFIISN